MSNYIQPDYRVPTIQSSGVFVFETQLPINLGPNATASPSQSDFRVPTTAGGVVNVDSELNLVNGPTGPGRYVQPGTPQG